MKFRIFISLVALMLLVFFIPSCYDQNWELIEAGLETEVKGNIFDYNIQKPVSNFTVYIEEYNAHPDSGLYFQRYIDSTTTNIEGDYAIKFVTTGGGVRYAVRLRAHDKAIYWGAYVSDNIIAGQANTFNFQLARLNTLKAKFKVVDNPYPPLKCFARYSTGGVIYEKDADITLFFSVMPGQINPMNFFINQPDTIANIVYERIDTVDLTNNFNDTVTAEFELHPREFELRKW